MLRPIDPIVSRIKAWRHPWIAFLSIFFGMLLLIEDCYWLVHGYEGWPQLTIMLVQLAGIGVLSINPLIGEFLFAAGMLSSELTLYTVSSSSLVVLFLILAVAGYTDAFEGAALTCVIALGRWMSSLSYSGEVGTPELAIYILECVFCCCLGMAIRWKQDRDAYLRTRRIMLHDMEVARRLHDYACNEISDVMLLLSRIEDGGDASELRMVQELSSSALCHVRDAVGMLERTSHETETTVIPKENTVGDEFGEYVAAQSSILRVLGFEGTIIIADDLRIPEEIMDMLRGLIRELFGNIAKHADGRNGYTFTIGWDGENMIITQCDTPKPRRLNGPAVCGGQGTGLKRYCDMVYRMHGQWEQREDDALWSVEIKVPLRDNGKNPVRNDTHTAV